VTQSRHPDRAHAPGTLILHGMSLADQRATLRAWERWDARRRVREAPPTEAEDAYDVPALPPAEECASPPAPQWLPLWADGDPDAPALPSPEQVRAKKRRGRQEAFLQRLLAEHDEALTRVVVELAWPLLVPRVRQLLAADLPGALRALGLQPEAPR
jgi:hypothetical protein